MFKKIEGGTKYKIDTNAGYSVNVWIPPIGYGFNTLTGEIEKTDIIKASAKSSEQFWQRIELPKNYKEKREKEVLRQKANPEYFDIELEKIRERHWTYRLCGLWFYSNGAPVYITGEHYMYLNWWKLMDGYPEYRNCDRERYYFQEFCVHDDRCAGIIEGSNRRSGKSYRAGLFLYNYTSMTEDARGGMQSKTDLDAKSFFRSKIVTPFKRLPHFFQPEIDLSAGSNMGKEIKFTKTAKRGKAAMDNIDDLGLNSFLDFRASGEYAYDGEPQQRNVQDEIGKPSDADVYERWGVVKYCLRVGKRWIGKALLTTTPEELDGISMDQHPFFKLWDESDYDNRDENGHTKTGLYRYFIPATETLEVDKYGMPKIEPNLTYILNTRANLKNNLKKLLAEIKKNCITVEEMFKATLSKSCMFNEEKLVNRLEMVSYSKEFILRGNFVWSNGNRDTAVEFVKDKNGSVEILKSAVDELTGKMLVERRGNISIPRNCLTYTMGVDPFDHDQTIDKRRSKGSFFVYQKYDPFSKFQETNCSAVCMYLARPDTAALFYEDVIKACVFFGADVLFETQKIGIKRYFQERGYERHFIKLPRAAEYGIASSPTTKELMAEYIDYHIENFCDRIYFKRLIEQLLEFDIKATEKYDAVMAFGYSLIADKNRMHKKREESVRDISDILPSYLLN